MAWQEECFIVIITIGICGVVVSFCTICVHFGSIIRGGIITRCYSYTGDLCSLYQLPIHTKGVFKMVQWGQWWHHCQLISSVHQWEPRQYAPRGDGIRNEQTQWSEVIGVDRAVSLDADHNPSTCYQYGHCVINFQPEGVSWHHVFTAKQLHWKRYIFTKVYTRNSPIYL